MSGKRKVRMESEGNKSKDKVPSKRTKNTKSNEPRAKLAEPSTKNCTTLNFTQCFSNTQIGRYSVQAFRKASHGSIIKHISGFSLHKSESPFQRRITFLTWHPKNSKLLCVGSKSGDIVLWNYDKPLDRQLMIQGAGSGCSILSIKCHQEKEAEIFTASLDDRVCLWNYETKSCTLLQQLDNTRRWCTSLDANFSVGSLVVGDSDGYLNLLMLDGTFVWRKRLHKNKISHAEFSSRESWLLTTSSIDHTVKMWDIRFIKEKEGPLTVLQHDYAVNSSYFSATDGARILTTDQHSLLRIYKAPLWTLETIIPHPHRQFQHLTPIKATWHPLEDIVVVGRYPDARCPGYMPGECRSVDFFQAETGKYLYELTHPGVNGIISLNRFNNIADTLASGMGFKILIWRPRWEKKVDPLKFTSPKTRKCVIKLRKL